MPLVVNFIFPFYFNKFVILNFSRVEQSRQKHFLSPYQSVKIKKKKYNDSLNVVLKRNTTPSPRHPVRQRGACNKPRPDLCARNSDGRFRAKRIRRRRCPVTRANTRPMRFSEASVFTVRCTQNRLVGSSPKGTATIARSR